jgi:hypothetical protein
MAPWASRNFACTSKHYELIRVYLPLKKIIKNMLLQKVSFKKILQVYIIACCISLSLRHIHNKINLSIFV